MDLETWASMSLRYFYFYFVHKLIHDSLFFIIIIYNTHVPALKEVVSRLQ